eukprot:TRINITY_DN6465_c0_g5_i1.p1 TRINITY_DN6465_c0_g5~~TRINITY_DN6465_c0_g5_i1.p1  ORF type:complete len:635 (-),score=154.30 TRINITY_DN6465_c0_g5_i1:77-1981(-)
MKTLVVLFVVATLFACTFGDVYLHNPRGSNNRLNETNTNRNNNNRLFNSQNNAKGGYCWGPPLYFYGGSRLSIEWTNQHGCGNPNVNCEIVIQYMCENKYMQSAMGWNSWFIRDGINTNTPDNDNATVNNAVPDPVDFRQTGPHDTQGDNIPDGAGNEPGRQYACIGEARDGCQVHERGLHEPWEYYDACRRRDRNKGLFIADQNVGGAAINTRQNPGGGRSGLECPEERDYYPYWHPTPWRDIAILTDDTDRCDYYESNGNNNNELNYCTEPKFNNEKDCYTNGGKWKSWSHSVSKVSCFGTPSNRDNHLGNEAGSFTTNMFNWTLPNADLNKCVLRVRYNISSSDYDGWDTDSSSNGKAKSPVVDDPYVEPFNDGSMVRLAIDTTQFGRTFQDRSYVFSIRERPSDIAETTRIWNLNVRGKRGNIVQAYPAVEYDFTPNRLEVREGDYIHFQWTGCDTNPQGNDGEGEKGTDRSNLVFLDALDDNKNGSQSFFPDDDDAYDHAFLGMDARKCAADFAALKASGANDDDIDRDPKNCAKLNAASRYFNGGLHKITNHHAWSNYYYMSSRNNNFTNRSQKGSILVVPFLPIWAIVLVVLSGVILLGSVGVFGVGIWGRIFPDGKIAGFLGRIPF